MTRQATSRATPSNPTTRGRADPHAHQPDSALHRPGRGRPGHPGLRPRPPPAPRRRPGPAAPDRPRTRLRVRAGQRLPHRLRRGPPRGPRAARRPRRRTLRPGALRHRLPRGHDPAGERAAEVGFRPDGRGRRRRDRLDPAVRGRRRARRRHRRPPCGPRQPAVHGRGLRPAAGALHRAAHHGARQTHRERPARRGLLRWQRRRRWLARLGHRSADRQSARRPAGQGGPQPGRPRGPDQGVKRL
ncbi:hypothetical protein GA0115255_125734 [Streptomyces sp. Ncost-T6T-2b]|nr:hypothetical protein GA0115255_125734 [Streptomyces sp. Ncost-T6T-2b]